MSGTLKLCIPALVMTSCTIASPASGEETQAETSGNPVTLSDLAVTALRSARLDTSNAAVMGATASSRKVLAAAVRCALSSTQTIAFSVGGITYRDPGGVGLAPSWTISALTATQASWVSACLIAHVNDVSQLVWISVRGSNATLAASSAELTGYRVEEGAFWGNVFVDLGAVAAYSCVGVDQAIDDSYGDLPLRQCAQWDGVSASNKSPCGMRYAGTCSSACSTRTAPYAGCSYLGGAATGPVVTTFLAGALPQ